jgi:hypothetical protein
MKGDIDLTAYQRGNRDGLISFAKWAMEMYMSYRKDAEKLEFKACENGALARENVRKMITTRRWMAESFKNAAEHALRMSESLPIDPNVDILD